MAKIKVDDPLEATQVHGCCGIWGVIAVAFFAKDKGIFYGADGSGKLLGAQCVGCIAIIAWVCITCGLFFYISMARGYLRLSEADEILGGDIHYFGPLQFTGKLYTYDLEEEIEKKIEDSPHRKKERNTRLNGSGS